MQPPQEARLCQLNSYAGGGASISKAMQLPAQSVPTHTAGEGWLHAQGVGRARSAGAYKVEWRCERATLRARAPL